MENPEEHTILTEGRKQQERMNEEIHFKEIQNLADMKTNIDICLACTRRGDFLTLRIILRRPISRFDLGYSKLPCSNNYSLYIRRFKNKELK